MRDAHDFASRRVATFGFGDESGYNVPILQDGQTLVEEMTKQKKTATARKSHHNGL